MATKATSPLRDELERLVEAELSYRRRRAGLKGELEQTRLERNLAIAEAAARGLTTREIGRALGISAQRVHQIIEASR